MLKISLLCISNTAFFQSNVKVAYKAVNAGGSV